MREHAHTRTHARACKRVCVCANTHAHIRPYTTTRSMVCDWLEQWHWYNSSEGVQSLNSRFEGKERQAKNSDQLKENCSGWCSSTNTQSLEVKKRSNFLSQCCMWASILPNIVYMLSIVVVQSLYFLLLPKPVLSNIFIITLMNCLP